MGEGEASLFEGFPHRVDALVRDEDVVGEIGCFKEDGAVEWHVSTCALIAEKPTGSAEILDTYMPASARGEVNSRTL
jgi:hypothetical protein